jgi:HSP20 family protein
MSSLTPWRGQSRQGELARYSNPFEQFHRQFDDLFNQLFGGMLARPEGFWEPTRFWDFGVEEQGNEYVVRAEMPGFDENDLNVRVHDDVLTIEAEKKQEGKGERSYRSFRRSVTLPKGVNADQIQGTYTNGVLELHVPRPLQQPGKRIPIQGGQKAGPGQKAQAAAGGPSEAGKAAKREASAPAGKA